jgi:multidrug efflux pump subunit AcrA (membrane-fusion protein)
MTGFDTGGLNWVLNVQDQFTGPLQDFNRQIDLVRRQQAAASREARARAQEARAQAREQREVAAAQRRAALDQQRFDFFARRNTNILANQRDMGGLTRSLDNFRRSINSSTSAGNRLVFTLRNIIGVGAGLAVIQNVQGAFRGLVEAGIDFNKELETAQTGIAGLLTAVTDVVGENGNLVDGPEAFNIALGVSKKQVEELRKATLRTTASFEELSNTFQVALAPGLKAGFNIDQIRELAIAVSQAAGAIGVPTNQLSEEIRALLTGTIQARTTRIATALGIRPDDIRRAKNDVNGLFGFLDARFKAFELAGERAAGTFSGSFRRARAAISLTAGEAIKPFFEEIRTTLLDVFDLFTDRTAFGELLPSPQAVKVLAAVFDGMADAVKTIRENAKQISFEKILSTAQGLGDFFRGLGQVVSGFVAGAINAFSAITSKFRELFAGADLVKFSAILGSFITSIALFGAAFGAVHIAISSLLLPLRTITTTIDTLIATSRLLLTPWTALLVAVFPLAELWRQIAEDVEKAKQTKEAASPANELSLETRLRQNLLDLQKEQLSIQEKLDKDDRNAITTRNLEKRLRVLQSIIPAAQAALKAEQETVKSGRVPDTSSLQGTQQTPAEETRNRFERAKDFVKGLVADITGLLAAAPIPIPVTPDPVAGAATLTADEKAAFALIPETTPAEQAQAEQDARSRAKLVAKATLDEFGDALLDMADMTEAGLNLMKSAISEFGSFVADTIVDAFDPTNDTSFKERFARFLQSLARQIIATLTQIAVAKLLLNIGVGSVGGGTVANKGGFVEGFAEGGPVGPKRGPYVLPRPASVPASDTVPAWLTPGEFVHKAGTVAHYGADVLDAINEGMVDPMALRELAGLANRSRSFRRTQRMAFADGGLVASGVAAQQAAAGVTAGTTVGAPMPAFIVGNDKAVDRFLKGGKAAFMDFINENKQSLKAMLGQ